MFAGADGCSESGLVWVGPCRLRGLCGRLAVRFSPSIKFLRAFPPAFMESACFSWRICQTGLVLRPSAVECRPVSRPHAPPCLCAGPSPPTTGRATGRPASSDSSRSPCDHQHRPHASSRSGYRHRAPSRPRHNSPVHLDADRVVEGELPAKQFGHAAAACGGVDLADANVLQVAAELPDLLDQVVTDKGAIVLHACRGGTAMKANGHFWEHVSHCGLRFVHGQVSFQAVVVAVSSIRASRCFGFVETSCCRSSAFDVFFSLSSRALMATITVLADISTAPRAGVSSTPQA